MRQVLLFLIMAVAASAQDKPPATPQITEAQNWRYLKARAKLAETKLALAAAEKELKDAADAMFATCAGRPVPVDQATEKAVCGELPPTATPVPDEPDKKEKQKK